jgi:rhodanese-related sulfurtransferase
VRILIMSLLTGSLLLASAAPAAPPDAPVQFIRADELKSLLDGGTRADIIDVRDWNAYVEMHITGSRSMPLRAIETRAGEITRTGLVVFY